MIGGTGIKSLSHITKEFVSALRSADNTLYLVNEPLLEEWIQRESNSSENLRDIYYSFSSRYESYRNITEKILSELKIHREVFVVFYGHPTLLAKSTVDAANKAKRDFSCEVVVLPGISSQDCLFADLLINPGDYGCCSVEATNFLSNGVSILPSMHVIIWQPGLLGQLGHEKNMHANARDEKYFQFKSKLLDYYPESHEVVLYEASLFPNIAPRIERVKLSTIDGGCPLNDMTTLYIPPYHQTD